VSASNFAPRWRKILHKLHNVESAFGEQTVGRAQAFDWSVSSKAV
jgi:hypothetical protein